MSDKEFRVRNGLIVGNNIFVANVTSNTVTVSGTINATSIQVNGATIPSGATSNLVFDAVNTAFNVANAAFGSANNVAPQVAPAFNTANAAYTLANVAYTATNSVFGVANAAFNSANNVAPQVAPAFNTANAAYTTANAGYSLTNSTYAAVNSAFGVVNAAYTQSNSEVTRLSAAYVVANAAYGNANTLAVAANNYAGVMANSSNAYASATYVKLTAGQQTITGDLAVTGNLTFLGNSTIISSNNLVVGDSLIYLAANNYSGTDILDIGFIANYGNTTGANVHTGLIRDATDKQYYLFSAYDREPANNTFVPGSNNMVNAVLVADLNTSNLTLGGANAIVWIKSSYDNSNGAFGVTNAAFGHSNTTYGAVNSAFGVVNSAYGLANSNSTRLSAAYVVANAAFGVANGALTTSNYSSYALPLSGGTMTGKPTVSITGSSTAIAGTHLTLENPSGSQSALGFSFGGTGKASIRIDSSGSFVLNGASNTYFFGYDVGATTSYFYNAGSQFMYVTGANVYVPTDIRTPIVYDSDNTGYYVNPNSSSLVEIFRVANRLRLGSNDNYVNINYDQIWRPDNGDLHLQYSGSGNLNMCNGGGYAYVPGTSIRAPIFYDQNDTAAYWDGAGGNSRLGRDLYVSGWQSGVYGNRVIVGNTTATYTLEDGNQRPVIQIHGAYPVLSLNHTVTSNGSHGPTLQFTANGTGSQFVMGMNGTGTQLDIGLSSTSNWNPHNGIASYSGTTGWRMDNSGNVYSFVSSRSPIFYDQNDTGYYIDPNSTSLTNVLGVGTTGYGGRLKVYNGGTLACSFVGGWSQYGKVIQCRTEGGSGGDGPMVWFDKSDYKSWGCGIEPYGNHGFYISEDSTTSGWGTTRWIIRPGGAQYTTFIYDLNDTGYYCDPNGTSVLNIVYHNAGTAYFRGGTGVDQCCGDDGAISIGGSSSKPPRIAWHYSGVMEGTIEGSGSGWRKIYFYDQQGAGLGVHATGQIASNGNVVAYYSDRRLKEDFEKVTDHWNVINNVSGYRFTWNQRAAEIPGFINNVGKREVGLIAQEVLEVYPEAVYTRTEGPEDDPYKTILHDRFNPIFIEALKDLRKEIDDLKNEIRELKNGK